ncbi:flagellar biogenesis protein FliO [Paraburkholderia sp. WC7.3d]
MFSDIARDFGQPVMLWQVAILLATLVVAWLLARTLRRRIARPQLPRYQSLRFGMESLDRAAFPLIGAALVWLARATADEFMDTALLDLALVPLAGIGLIYIVFFFARRVFNRDGGQHPWLFLVEKIVSVVVWIGMVLTLLGIQNAVIAWMDSVSFRVGNAHMTILSLITGLLWVGVTMIVAMWLGSSFEDRLMRSKTLDANLKVVVARVGRAAFVLAAILISLSIVGIDITVLGVFGGALGVGLGFGMQKIASNYVSGFIILLDRSLRIGDTINVSGLQGPRHADPHALYRRARAGRHRDADSERKADHRRRAEPVVVSDSWLRQGGRADRLHIRRRAGDDAACPGRRRRAARAARAGADAISGRLRPGWHQSRAGLLDRGCGERHGGRTLDGQSQHLASLFRARHHDSARATRGAHRWSGGRRDAAPDSNVRAGSRRHGRYVAQARRRGRQRRSLSPGSCPGEACAGALAIAIDLMAHKKSLFVTNTWNASSRISSYPAVCFHFHDTRAACGPYLSFRR